MYFNEEQLKNIEEMAYQLFSPFEIALALETEEADEFIEEISTPGTDIHKAFYKGYLRQLGEFTHRHDKSRQKRQQSCSNGIIEVYNQYTKGTTTWLT